MRKLLIAPAFLQPSGCREVIVQSPLFLMGCGGSGIGLALAQRAKDKGISVVVFDRGGYIFHGRVAALAEGAREGGLEF